MEGSAGSVGRIMAPLLGVPADHHARLRAARARVPARQLHPRRPRGLRGWTASTCPRRTASASASPTPTSRRQRATPELRALIEHEVGRARRLFAAAGPAVAAAPAAVRPGVRLACAVYESVLDRVEAAGYDVLGRRMGVRFCGGCRWLAFGALRP